LLVKVGISTKQKMMIAALLRERTIIAACASCGIAWQTYHRWMDQPAFKAALQAETDAALSGLSRSMLSLTDKATNALEETLDNDGPMAAGARIRAADIVLSRLLALKELVELDRRIAALEGSEK
jgi:hypothetical protein